ncbi:MAG: hypothetical protein IJ418_22800 [Clostridia bacterium]|nr:hypothetical protein [Clostridia bacterium]
MAVNTFDALMTEVNRKIAEADAEASQANAAAALASEAAQSAQEEAQTAQEAATAAQEAAQNAQTAADAWEIATVEAVTAPAGSQASVTLTQEEGAKKLSFVIPCGADGAKGEKGDTGRSGVTFTLSGTKLYITTD